jgi:Tfp pilus assembly protein PilP
VPAGLTPLPTSEQVAAAFPVGRKDPFGSLVAEMVPGAAAAARGGAAVAAAAAPAFLQDFRVTGVIDSGGQSEAVVTYKQLSGSLRRGDRGGRNTDLLPSGWSVASVDVANGHLILQSGSRRVKVDL